MTAESIRWRWWPPGGIWIEKVTTVLSIQEDNDGGEHLVEMVVPRRRMDSGGEKDGHDATYTKKLLKSGNT